MSAKIYTRTGDEGTTGSLEGKRPRKDDSIIEINGLIDEAQVAIQRARVHFISYHDETILKQLDKIIEALYLFGAEVSNGKAYGLNRSISQGFVDKLEEKIDKYYIQVNSFQYFNTICSLDLEEARVRVRKLERELTSMLRQKRIRPVLYAYINRLSDYLFTLAVYYEKKKGESVPVIDS